MQQNMPQLAGNHDGAVSERLKERDWKSRVDSHTSKRNPTQNKALGRGTGRGGDSFVQWCVEAETVLHHYPGTLEPCPGGYRRVHRSGPFPTREAASALAATWASLVKSEKWAFHVVPVEGGAA